MQQQYQGNQFLAHAEAIPDLRRKTSKHVKMVSQGFARYSWPRGADVSLLAAATAAASAVSYRLTLRSPVQGSPIVNKTLVAAWPRAGSTYLLHNSTGVITSNLTIHGGGNMAVVEDHGGGSHVHENLSIVRRQQDPVCFRRIGSFPHLTYCHLAVAKRFPMMLCKCDCCDDRFICLPTTPMDFIPTPLLLGQDYSTARLATRGMTTTTATIACW